MRVTLNALTRCMSNSACLDLGVTSIVMLFSTSSIYLLRTSSANTIISQ